MTDHLHIVSLVAPSPPDYGGAFDLYYKVKALSEAGKKIVLHYFDYKEGRGHEGLKPYCEEINTYNRTAFIKSLLTLKPYIVSSRIEAELIHRLNRDDHPVLLEGIHCTGIIPYLRNRKILVRIHNNEAEYYHQLQQNEDNIFKALYFFYESALLSRYQKKLSNNPVFLFVSEKDKQEFKVKYKQPDQLFLPCFVPWQELRSLSGTGTYCLYHGNLSISENIGAALWLAQTVFSEVKYPLVIAGKDAGDLKNKLPSIPNITLVNNPTDEELSGLIQNAHINVLPSFNNTGVKLKLIHALFEGRFCFTNHAGIVGSGLDQIAPTFETPTSWIAGINEAITTEFTSKMIEERKLGLRIYDNEANAKKLIELL